jgi:hypothetical protein
MVSILILTPSRTVWDAISSEESVALVASFLSKPPVKSFPRAQITSKLLPDR